MHGLGWQRSAVLISTVLLCTTAMTLPSSPLLAQTRNSIGKTMPADAAPLNQQVLRQVLAEPSTLDVGIALFDAQFIAFLFEQLCVFDENLELKPGAAQSWSHSSDGKQWTFRLRPGGKWSDGRPVTAHDFEWSFRRLIAPESGNVYAYFYYPIKGARAFNTGKTKDPKTVGVKALDDMTLVIETEEPCAYFPMICAFFTSVPAPRWQVEKYGRKWTDQGNCVSNSTWALDTWQPGRGITFKLNTYYNGPFKGYLEKLVFKFAPPGWDGAVLAYENNEIDRAGVVGADFKRVKNDPKLGKELTTFPNFGTYYTIFQTTRSPFNNIKLRQAIAHAIDREAICNTVIGGAGTPAYGMLPAGFPGYKIDDLKQYQAFNPTLAKKLLVEAGYPGGRGLPKLELQVRSPSSAEQNVVVAIQQMLKDHLGLTVQLQNQTMQVFNDRMVKHEIPWGFLWFNTDYPDPSDMIAVPWRSQPPGSGRQDWKNDAFDRLVDAAAREFNEQKRLAMYHEAEKILAREAGGVFLYNLINAGLNKPWVKGVAVNKYGHKRWSGLTPSYAMLYIGRH